MAKLKPGGRAKVTATADERFGQVGIVDYRFDEDGEHVFLLFDDDPDLHAFGFDEVTPMGDKKKVKYTPRNTEDAGPPTAPASGRQVEPGGWALVTAPGDQRLGQVGIVDHRIDEHGEHVFLLFDDDPDLYAFLVDEVTAVDRYRVSEPTSPEVRTSTAQGPKDPSPPIGGTERHRIPLWWRGLTATDRRNVLIGAAAVVAVIVTAVGVTARSSDSRTPNTGEWDGGAGSQTLSSGASGSLNEWIGAVCPSGRATSEAPVVPTDHGGIDGGICVPVPGEATGGAVNYARFSSESGMARMLKYLPPGCHATAATSGGTIVLFWLASYSSSDSYCPENLKGLSMYGFTYSTN